MEPTGRELFDEVLKVRNDLAGSTLVMVTRHRARRRRDLRARLRRLDLGLRARLPGEGVARVGVDEGEEGDDAQR